MLRTSWGLLARIPVFTMSWVLQPRRAPTEGYSRAMVTVITAMCRRGDRRDWDARLGWIQCAIDGILDGTTEKSANDLL